MPVDEVWEGKVRLLLGRLAGRAAMNHRNAQAFPPNSEEKISSEVREQAYKNALADVESIFGLK